MDEFVGGDFSSNLRFSEGEVTMEHRNRYRLFSTLIILLIFCISCDWDPLGVHDPINQVVAALDDAIGQLAKESADWRSVLEKTRDKLVGDAQSTIRNEITDLLTRTIAATGAELRCNVDFTRTRVRQDLERIKAKLLNKTISPKEPALCVVNPLGVDASLIPDRLKWLEFYGYDFDTTPVQVFLQNGSQMIDVSQYLDKPTHYHMTLNLGANGVKIAANSQRFILKWNNQEISSIAITFPNPATKTPQPTPEPQGKYFVSKLSGRCVDVYGTPGVNNGAKLQLYDCEFGNPATDQLWIFRPDGFIQNKQSQRCIDVKGTPGVENGTKLQLWDCEFNNTSSDQIWTLTTDGYFKNRYGRCIDVSGTPGMKNEDELQIWDCEFGNTKTDQQWIFK